MKRKNLIAIGLVFITIMPAGCGLERTVTETVISSDVSSVSETAPVLSIFQTEEYEKYGRSDRWDEVLPEDQPVQIDDLVYTPGMTVSELLEYMGTSAVTYDTSAVSMDETVKSGETKECVIKRDGNDWIKIVAENLSRYETFTDEELPLKDCVVIQISPCEDAYGYARYMDGTDLQELFGSVTSQTVEENVTVPDGYILVKDGDEADTYHLEYSFTSALGENRVTSAEAHNTAITMYDPEIAVIRYDEDGCSISYSAPVNRADIWKEAFDYDRCEEYSYLEFSREMQQKRLGTSDIARSETYYFRDWTSLNLIIEDSFLVAAGGESVFVSLPLNEMLRNLSGYEPVSVDYGDTLYGNSVIIYKNTVRAGNGEQGIYVSACYENGAEIWENCTSPVKNNSTETLFVDALGNVHITENVIILPEVYLNPYRYLDDDKKTLLTKVKTIEIKNETDN